MSHPKRFSFNLQFLLFYDLFSILFLWTLWPKNFNFVNEEIEIFHNWKEMIKTILYLTFVYFIHAMKRITSSVKLAILIDEFQFENKVFMILIRSPANR